MSLRNKTALLLALLVTVALFGSAAVLLRLYEQSLRESILAGTKATADATALSIAGFFDDTLRDVEVVASTLPPAAVERRDKAAIERHLQRLQPIYPKFQNGMFLLDAEGRMVSDYPAHPALHGQSFAYREYFQRTMQEQRGVVGQPYRSARTGEAVVTFTAPLRNARGEVVGLLGCSVQLTSPSALGGVRQQRFGSTGYVYVFDKSRQMILHPDEKRILQRDVPPGVNRLFDAAAEGYAGVGQTVNSRGVRMLLAVQPVRGTDWIVGAQQPEAEAFQPVEEAKRQAGYTMLLAVLAAALIGAVAIRHITTPLSRLGEAARRLGVGLHGIPADPARDPRRMLRRLATGDEIGLLAGTLAELADKLDSTFASLKDSVRDWERTFNSVQDPVFIVDAGERIVRLNRAAADRLRLEPGQVLGRAVHEALRDALGMETPSGLLQAPMRAEIRGMGDAGVFEMTVTPLFGDTGVLLGAVLILRDITERKKAEARVQELAYFDALTGLPNRPMLLDRIEQALALADRIGGRVGIMFLDLDRFKQINDSLGHDAGDLLLKTTAQRLTGQLRRNDTVARYGGDEFVVLLQDLSAPEEAATVARKVVESLSEPVSFEDEVITTGTSIGIALYPQDAMDAASLLRHADTAMYKAKQQGGGSFVLFTPDLQKPQTKSRPRQEAPTSDSDVAKNEAPD